MAISIYKYPQVLHLTLGSIQHNCARTGVNMIVSQHYTNSLVKLFRNTDQRIDLLLKDWDRIPIKLEEWEEVWFKLFDGKIEVLEKEAELLDFDRGHYVVSFSNLETGGLHLGDFSYCIVIKDTEEDTTRMLWTNQDYGAAAPAKVIEGPLPQQAEALDIDPDDLTLLSGYYVSSALAGAVAVNNDSGVHSIVLILDNYTGELVIEASLDTDIPASSNDWIAAKTVSYEEETGTVHLTMTGNYNWVRLKFDTVDGVEEISYRNF